MKSVLDKEKNIVNATALIEHLEFRAFNEGTRLVNSILTSQGLTTKTKLKMMGADAIYATRKILVKKHILLGS